MTNHSEFKSSVSMGSDELQDSVRKAHVMVGTEIRDRPIQHFTCRELPVAKLELFDITIDPIVINRRSEDIADDEIDDILLSTQVVGTVLIKQGDAEFTQHPGRLVIMSAGEPYSIVHTQQSHRLILHFPKAVYQERILGNQPGDRFRPRLFADGGLPGILCGMMLSLSQLKEELSLSEQYTLSESLMDLTATILRSDVDQEREERHAKQSALFRRILEYMESNYMDPEMTPEKIARANGISMRYLHSLFHQAGISVSKWLWDRRLRATREDLLDPNMSHMRVGQIAFRRGFNDPAHFSRSFRKRFDISPTKLRQIANTRAG